MQTDASVRYVETTLANAAGEMDDILKRRGYDFFCLNDGSKPEISLAKRTRNIRIFLERYFSIAAVWEQTGAITPLRGSASSSAVQDQPAG